MSIPFKLIFACALFIGLNAAPLAAQKTKPVKSTALDSIAIRNLRLSEDTLAILAYAVINDSIEGERFAACRSLITTLVRSLKVENSFQYPFDRLKSISILAPPDSSFRIFTWQLFVNDSTYRYYGAIQINSKTLQLYPLIDRSFDMEIPPPTHHTLPPDRWYGALYYNLRAFDTKNGPQYLLFGYDAYQFFEKRKIVDVLSFDKNMQPVFGAQVFDRPNQPQNGPEYRIFLEYSAETPIRCNWDDQYQMIIFEHLIPWPSPYGRGMTQVPDGSYDALQYEKGRWKFIDKVFNDSQEEAPTIEPVLSKDKDNNILGDPKKPKKGKRP